MNKKVIVAVCMVAVMLAVPISVAVYDADNIVINDMVPVVEDRDAVSDPQITISPIRLDTDIINTVEEIKTRASFSEKEEIESILESIIADDDSVDVDALFTLLDKYDYFRGVNAVGKEEYALFGIPNELLDNFVTWLYGKLGWTYGGYLMLMNIYSEALGVLNVVDLYEQRFEIIKDAFQEAKDLLDALFPFNLWNISMWIYLFNTNWQVLISAVTIIIDVASQWIGFLTGSGEYPDVIQALMDVRDAAVAFSTWIGEEHWAYPIMICGTVLSNHGNGIGDVMVECRGNTTMTDEEGYFSMFVSSVPTEEDMIQAQAWMHNCQITVTLDSEETDTSPKWASSSFADGIMEWWFTFETESHSDDTLDTPSSDVVEPNIPEDNEGELNLNGSATP